MPGNGPKASEERKELESSIEEFEPTTNERVTQVTIREPKIPQEKRDRTERTTTLTCCLLCWKGQNQSRQAVARSFAHSLSTVSIESESMIDFASERKNVDVAGGGGVLMGRDERLFDVDDYESERTTDDIEAPSYVASISFSLPPSSSGSSDVEAVSVFPPEKSSTIGTASVGKAQKNISNKNDIVNKSKNKKKPADSAWFTKSASFSNRRTANGSSITKRKPPKKLPRTVVLRVLLVLSLLIAAGICATVSYVTISNLERSVGVQTYKSVAVSAIQGAQSIAHRKLVGSQVAASMMSYAFPNRDDWPFVFLNGYTQLNKLLATMSSSSEHGLIHVFDSRHVNAKDFEAYIKTKYDESNFSNTTGYSDFGFGIWKKQETEDGQVVTEESEERLLYDDGRVPDQTGITNTYESLYPTLLTPIVKVAHKSSTNMLYNMHSDEFRGSAIDSVLQCTEEVVPTRTRTTPTMTMTSTADVDVDELDIMNIFPKCHVVTDMIKALLHIRGPASVIYTPIYPANDNPKTTVVGMIGKHFIIDAHMTQLHER